MLDFPSREDKIHEVCGPEKLPESVVPADAVVVSISGVAVEDSSV